MRRRPAVVGAQHLLAEHRHKVHRAPAKVGHGVLVNAAFCGQGPAHVEGVGARMTGVGLRHRVALGQALGGGVQGHIAGPTPAAHTQQLAVPAFGQAQDHADARP